MTAHHGPRWLEREDVGDVSVIRFTLHRLQDEDTARTVFKQIYSLVDEVGRTQIVVNLDGVEYLASAAIGKLIMLNKKVQIGSGRLALCHLSPDVDAILNSMRLKDVLHVYATEAEAVQSFQAGAAEGDAQEG